MQVNGKVRSTFQAPAGGAAFGFDLDGIVAMVAALTPEDFDKRIATQADHRVWQEVYRPSMPTGEVYLKINVIDNVPIVPFKEL